MLKLFKNTIKRIFINSLKKSSRFGSYIFFILISLTFLSLGYIKEFVFLITGLFLLYFFAIPIRLIFFKNRPKKRKYSNIIEKIDASSIPSLHAGRTLFLFLFLINFFQNQILFTIYISIISICIIYSRIYKKEHDLVDISFGILLGILVWYLTKIFLF